MSKERIPPLYVVKERFAKVRELLRQAERSLGNGDGAELRIDEAKAELSAALDWLAEREAALARRAEVEERARQERITALEAKIAKLKD